MDTPADIVSAIEQQSAVDLGRHYTWKKQLLEVCSVIVFTCLMAVALYKAWTRVDLRANAGIFAAAFFLSMVVADFISGFVHWLADTWGTVEIPILGPTLIKNFREHHADPKALTRKGLIETNGDNCMILFPAQVGALFIPLDAGPTWTFAFAFVLSFVFWIMITNQVHKWAHFEWNELSAPVRFLMRTHVILSVSEHKIHHTAPFESHYSITNGWLNGPLRWTGFYRHLERIGFRVFGAIPRENDIGTAAAVALAIRQGVLPPDFVPERVVTGTRSTPTSAVS
jgi:ubiquitin-conjugating enzyme E2 variant